MDRVIELILAVACLLVIGAINEQLHEGKRPARGAPRVVTMTVVAPAQPEPLEPGEPAPPSDLPTRTLDGYRTGWTAP